MRSIHQYTNWKTYAEILLFSEKITWKYQNTCWSLSSPSHIWSVHWARTGWEPDWKLKKTNVTLSCWFWNALIVAICPYLYVEITIDTTSVAKCTWCLTSQGANCHKHIEVAVALHEEQDLPHRHKIGEKKFPWIQNHPTKFSNKSTSFNKEESHAGVGVSWSHPEGTVVIHIAPHSPRRWLGLGRHYRDPGASTAGSAVGDDADGGTAAIVGE